jgi:hypothetical protein
MSTKIEWSLFAGTSVCFSEKYGKYLKTILGGSWLKGWPKNRWWNCAWTDTNKRKNWKERSANSWWEGSPLRKQRWALNCSAIWGGGEGEGGVSGYLTAAMRLQLAGIGTPFLAEPRFFRVHTRGEADTASYVIDTGGSYPKMWNTHGIKLTSHLHLMLRLRCMQLQPC